MSLFPRREALCSFLVVLYFLFLIRLCPPYRLSLLSSRPELVVKKLRYYARFIVVCLLLNKMDLVKVLVKVRPRLSFRFKLKKENKYN